MPVVTLGIPLDLTGAAPTNLFTNELVQFNTSLERFFVPSKGPFYTTTLEIRHGVTNALLQPETQFKILHPVKEAIRMSGKEVCTAIYITDTSIPSVRLTYRVIGGIFADTASEIGDIIANNPLSPSSEVSWWDILDKPNQFTPTEHLHHVDNIYGMDDVVAVLENMRIAILAGDSVAISAIYQYIHVLLTNLNYATMDDVMDLLGPSAPQSVRTYKTYADLRAVSSLINNESYIYIATGKHAVNDRKAKIFMWDNTCTINDDDEDIIRPNHISVGIPGRFVSVLIIESKFKLLAASLGRAFDTEGNLLSSFNSTGRIFEGDLNTLVEQGPWLFTAASTNRPARMTSLSSDPMAIGEGYIIVTKLDGKVIQEVLMAGLDVSPNGEFIAQRFKRAGLETAPGSGTYTWSRWDATASQNTLARFGIDRAIAVENSLPSIADLDNLVIPGKYWFGDSQDNRPFDWGILEVMLVGGSIVTPGEVYQYAYWDGRKASRSRNYLGVWSRWSFTQNLDIATEANISGQDLDSVLWPDIYYYNTTCANTPSNYGILEVRRENGYIIYQIAHSSDNRLFSRYRSSGGTWTVWREYADALTLSTFMTDTNAALGTLSSAMAAISETAKDGSLGGSYISYIPGTHSIVLAPGEAIRLVLFGAGGGGGAYGIDGGNGGSTEFRDGGNVIFSAHGGQGGYAGYGAESGTFVLDPPGRSSGSSNREYGFQSRVRGINVTNLPTMTDSHGYGGNSDGVSFSNMRVASHGGKSGCIDAEYVNPNTVSHTFTLYIPNGGSAANGQATDGDVGRAYIFRGK